MSEPGRKFALLLGNKEYSDPTLSKLHAPAADVEAVAAILRDPAIGAFDEVKTLVDGSHSAVSRAIGGFFSKRRQDDLLLLYFSGHGIRDAHAQLYLAVQDTDSESALVPATGISAAFISSQMDRCISQRLVLILDCCHSGAFAPGTKAATGESVGTAAAFRGNGYGRVVLTASDATEAAWEGEHVIGEAAHGHSLFSHYLIEGLQTGAADRDSDGTITLDELYDYVYEQVVLQAPKQTPHKWSFKQQGDIVIASNVNPRIKPVPLPKEIAHALENSLPHVRESIVPELARMLRGTHRGLALSARDALERLLEDDSRKVSSLAERALGPREPTAPSAAVQVPPAKAEPSVVIASTEAFFLDPLGAPSRSPPGAPALSPPVEPPKLIPKPTAEPKATRESLGATALSKPPIAPAPTGTAASKQAKSSTERRSVFVVVFLAAITVLLLVLFSRREPASNSVASAGSASLDETNGALVRAAAALAPAALAPASTAKESGPIKVGILHSLSGSMAISETSLKDVALMTIDQINLAGGLLGRKLEPVVVDPASNWPLFSEKARELLQNERVAVVFGCWTSVSRKSVLPVFEELNGLLFYPVQYEGEESSYNVFYTGAAPNQQALPGVEYLMSPKGGGAKKWVLLGTDYVYPRTTNKILRYFFKAKGVPDSNILEKYTPFGHSDYQSIVAEVKAFAAGANTALISSISGDSNVPFYKELVNQGVRASAIPVLALSVGEEELRGVDTKPLVGHLAAANYFMSIDTPENSRFVENWKNYAKLHNLPDAARRVTNDAMEATHLGIRIWAQAVEQAGTTDVDAVRQAAAGQRVRSPSGFDLEMDTHNHHLHKPVFVAEVRADGQFQVVWRTYGPIVASPWSPYIPDSAKKVADWTFPWRCGNCVEPRFRRDLIGPAQ